MPRAIWPNCVWTIWPARICRGCSGLPGDPSSLRTGCPRKAGRWQGEERDRQRLLEQAVSLGADYVDVEFNADPDWRRDILAGRGRSKIILSWHDFQGTSTPYRLADTMVAMAELQADIIKIVVYAHKPADCLALLALIPGALERGQDIIAFSMGPGRQIFPGYLASPGRLPDFCGPGGGAGVGSGAAYRPGIAVFWEILKSKILGHRLSKGLALLAAS